MAEYTYLETEKVSQQQTLPITIDPEDQEECPVPIKSCGSKEPTLSKHIIDCFLVGFIAAGTTAMATQTFNFKAVISIAVGGAVTAAIKLREYVVRGNGTSMIFF